MKKILFVLSLLIAVAISAFASIEDGSVIDKSSEFNVMLIHTNNHVAYDVPTVPSFMEVINYGGSAIISLKLDGIYSEDFVSTTRKHPIFTDVKSLRMKLYHCHLTKTGIRSYLKTDFGLNRYRTENSNIG